MNVAKAGQWIDDYLDLYEGRLQESFEIQRKIDLFSQWVVWYIER